MINICDGDFIFSISLLKVVLSHTSSLSDFLQKKTLDLGKARKNVQLVIDTLKTLRCEDGFDSLWCVSQIRADEVRDLIVENAIEIDFRDIKLPRASKWTGDLKSFYRANKYYLSIDKILIELETRFGSKDQDILFFLSAVTYDENVSDETIKSVAEYYGIDKDILKSQLEIYIHF